MLGHNTSIDIKQLANRFLCQPDIIILDTDFYSVFPRISRKYKEINGAVSYLNLVAHEGDSFLCFLKAVSTGSSYLSLT
jgi:hypothetical protein